MCEHQWGKDMKWQRVGMGYMAQRTCLECGVKERIDPYSPDGKIGGGT